MYPKSETEQMPLSASQTVVELGQATAVAQQLVELLAKQGKSIATAESCTGGLVSQIITQISGASQVFGFGFCTYANQAKEQILGVSSDVLNRYGAVSCPVASSMCKGAAKVAGADFGIGITGIAGPTGGTPEKPVGLVYVSVCDAQQVWVQRLLLTGKTREQVRHTSAQTALEMALALARGQAPEGDCRRFTLQESAYWNSQKEG